MIGFNQISTTNKTFPRPPQTILPSMHPMIRPPFNKKPKFRYCVLKCVAACGRPKRDASWGTFHRFRGKRYRCGALAGKEKSVGGFEEQFDREKEGERA